MIFKHFSVDLITSFKSFLSFSTLVLIFTISFSVKDRNKIIKLITDEIIVEYKILGKLYKKLKFPWSSYILCIVESLKNNAFTVK